MSTENMNTPFIRTQRNFTGYDTVADATASLGFLYPGLIIYEISTDSFFYWDGSAWQALGTGGGGGSSVYQIGASIDGLGSTIQTGQIGFSAIVTSGTIVSWTIVGDVTGDIVFDIKRNGVSIVGAGNKPTIETDTDNTALVSGWTSNTVTDGDLIEYVIESVASFKRINLFLRIQP